MKCEAFLILSTQTPSPVVRFVFVCTDSRKCLFFKERIHLNPLTSLIINSTT